MTLSDRIENLTRGQRWVVAVAIAWVFAFILFVLFLLAGGLGFGQAILGVLVVMGFPTMVILFVTGLVLWALQGKKRS